MSVTVTVFVTPNENDPSTPGASKGRKSLCYMLRRRRDSNPHAVARAAFRVQKRPPDHTRRNPHFFDVRRGLALRAPSMRLHPHGLIGLCRCDYLCDPYPTSIHG